SGFDILLGADGRSHRSPGARHELVGNGLWYCRHLLLCSHLFIDPETTHPTKHYLGRTRRGISSTDCLGGSPWHHRMARSRPLRSHLLMDSTALLAIVAEI